MSRLAAVAIGAVLLLSGALTTCAQARSRFPVPNCGWAPARVVSETVGERVTAAPAAWATSIAPVLTCRYLETEPTLQLAGVALVEIEFREQQFVRPPAGAVGVAGLGSCIARISCPKPGRPAWLLALSSTPTAGDSAGSVAAGAFVKLEALEVQDGLNEITIVVDNPRGPVAVAGETASLERLARLLLPRFRMR